MRRLLLLAVATVLSTTVGMTVLASPAHAVDYYRVSNLHSGLCMDNYAWTGKLYQYPCNAQGNQLWTWFQVPGRPDAWYISAMNSAYGCLETSGTGNSARIVLTACYLSYPNRTTAMWRWIHVSNGWHAIKNVASNRCIEAPNNSTSVVQLTQYDCHHRSNQLWLGEKRLSG